MRGQASLEVGECRAKQKLKRERSPIFLARAWDDPQSRSAMRVQSTRRSLRGPSNSQKKMFCQRESPSLPLTTGMVSEGPTRPDLRWASPLPSWASCSQTPLGMSLRRRSTTSRCHALVPVLLDHERGRRALRVHRARPRFTPLFSTNVATSAVISISSSRSWLPIRMTCCMVVPALTHLAHREYNLCHRPADQRRLMVGTALL